VLFSNNVITDVVRQTDGSPGEGYVGSGNLTR
jgi:hypothetical protein